MKDHTRAETHKLESFELAYIKGVKEMGNALINEIEETCHDPRSAALAKTKVQEAIFWATHGITA